MQFTAEEFTKQYNILSMVQDAEQRTEASRYLVEFQV